jgi:ribonuclease R
MLPEVISNGLASLQPLKPRYTKSVYMEFTEEGIRTHTEVHNAVIRSSRRFAYEEVDEYIENPKPWRKKLDPKVFNLLGRMRELARILRRRRIQRGALVLNMPEVKVDLGPDGRVSGAHVVKDTESHQIIEEFMVAANEATAELLAEKRIPFLRRIHEPPDPRKLKLLTAFVAELGLPTESLESRFELQKLLDAVKGRPEEYAVNYALLRSMQRAVYSPIEEGHYALASQCYCHFTSPIRRYPDLTIHRLIDAILARKKPRSDFDEQLVLGEHCSDREQRAEAAERELIKLKLLDYLSTRIGMEMDAVVTGVESYGLFAQGVELPAEGLIRVEALADDYYQFDRASHTLSGFRSGNIYRLGDRVRVAVVRVDLERRELDFRIVGRRKREAPAKTVAGKKPVKTLRKRATRKKASPGGKAARRKRTP